MKLLAQISADYRRHGRSLRNPATWAVMTYHFGVWAKERKFGPLRFASDFVYGGLALFVELASGTTIHRDAELGEEFHMVHPGNIKIDAGVRIGKGVGVMHHVTIAAADDRPGLPVIGDDAFIGTGATILGPVVIGAGARVASNSLVLDDVPAGATAIGVPARVLRYTGRPSPKAAQPRDSAATEAADA